MILDWMPFVAGIQSSSDVCRGFSVINPVRDNRKTFSRHLVRSCQDSILALQLNKRGYGPENMIWSEY